MTGDAMRDVIELLAMEQCSYRRVERCAHSCGSCSYKAAQQVAAITAAPASARLALARAITPDEWQDISTAPKDGTRILMLFPAYRGQKGSVDIGAWHHGAWHVPYFAEPTHWMHLPAPPAARGADAEGGK